MPIGRLDDFGAAEIIGNVLDMLRLNADRDGMLTTLKAPSSFVSDLGVPVIVAARAIDYLKELKLLQLEERKIGSQTVYVCTVDTKNDEVISPEMVARVQTSVEQAVAVRSAARAVRSEAVRDTRKAGTIRRLTEEAEKAKRLLLRSEKSLAAAQEQVQYLEAQVVRYQRMVEERTRRLNEA